MELLDGEMEKEPEMNRATIKKNLEAIIASCEDYAKFLRNLEKVADRVEKKILE